MVKVAWKTINGYGPYAYLQKSVRSGGKVTSKHIAYLGKAGLGKDGIALVPGKNFNAPAAKGFPGGRLKIPLVGEETEGKLKPKQKAAVEFMEEQAMASVATKDIIIGLKNLKSQKVKHAPVPEVGISDVKELKAAAAKGPDELAAAAVAIADKLPNTKDKAAVLDFAAQLHPEKQIGLLKAAGELKAKGGEVAPNNTAQQPKAPGVGASPASLKTLQKVSKPPAVGISSATLKSLGETTKPPGVGLSPAALKTFGKASQQATPTNGPKVGAIFFNTKGEQIASDANIVKLEEAAANAVGKLDPAAKTVEAAAGEALKEMDEAAEAIQADLHQPVEKSAISSASGILKEKILKATAHQVLDGGTDYFETPGAKADAKEPTKLVTIPDSSTPKSTDAAPAPAVAKVAPEKAAEAVQPKSSATGDAPKVQGLAATGLISKTNKKKLEDAAAKGVVELDAAAQAISDKLKTVKSKNGIAIAVKDLKSQMVDVQQSPPPKSADAAPAPKAGNIPVNSAGKQLISKDVVKELEEAAAQGPGELKATAKALNAKAKAPSENLGIDIVTHDLEDKLKPKLKNLPTDYKGQPYIAKTKVKKLEDAALLGIEELEATGSAMADQLKTPHKKTAILNAVADLKAQIQSKPKTAEDKPEAVAPNKPAKAAQDPAPAPTGAAPKVTDVPLNNKGKPLVSKANIKKLEAAAAKGIDELDATAKTIADKLLHPPKKAAVLNVAAELKGKAQGVAVQEGDGGSGLSQKLDKVDDGEVKLPKREAPSLKVMNEQEKKLKSGTKNYTADLVKVSGKKGSNEGGLFKDKQLNTLHYVKWPNSPARAKVEVLTALLYAYAKVPVPTVRVIRFQGKDAVMSDWIEDAATMSWDEITKHKDVREGFAVDAWLANWDVVGLQADNLVKGPGNKAYRIDVGGSMLFRAQGKPKAFPTDVPELESMRDSGTAPQASKAFKKLTPTQLKNGVKKVQAVTDAQIDYAVDSVKLPKKSKDYPASTFGKEANDLPEMLKARLKARRDWLVEEVLEAEKKHAATVAKLQEQSDLKQASIKAIVSKGSKYKATSPAASSKWALTGQVMRGELGKQDGDDANKATRDHWDGWKGSSISAKGAVLRWGAGAMTGEGRKELRRMEKFNDFLVKEKQMTKKVAQEHAKHLQSATTGDAAHDLVEGLRVTNKQNDVIHSIQNPGKEKVTLYRGWKTPQVKYIEAQSAKVGDTLTLDDPPLYSWSLSPNTAKSFGGGHGSFVTRAEVPIDRIVLSDIANSTGKFGGENEVVFKGVKKLEMEVTKTY